MRALAVSSLRSITSADRPGMGAAAAAREPTRSVTWWTGEDFATSATAPNAGYPRVVGAEFGRHRDQVHLALVVDLVDSLARRLENPNAWRIAMQVRGWIEHALPLDDVAHWITGSVDRARIVAGITHPGGTEPTGFAKLLLGEFDDPEITSSLQAAYTSGAWTGPWSDRIASQIDQLSVWVANTNLSLGVRTWAKETINRLRRQRGRART